MNADAANDSMPSTPRTENPDWLEWERQSPLLYDEITYKTHPLVRYITLHAHVCMESRFRKDDYFEKVLEIGAGQGHHLPHVRHRFGEYHITDVNAAHLEKAKEKHKDRPGVKVRIENALALSYPDDTFDRLISVYNLEHLPDVHLAIEEWKRVVKPGGVLSIAFPTEGGLAWNYGRHFSTRRYFRSSGLAYDYIIAREHINASYRLVALLQYYFGKNMKAHWFPFRIPTSHLNLIYCCQVRNP